MKNLILAFFVLILTSCQNSNEEKNSKSYDSLVTEVETVILPEEGDSTSSKDSIIPAPPPLKQNFKGAGLIREGSHQFTLHWISWDQPGKVMIKQIGDSLYSVKGKQTNPKNEDYVTIDGTFYTFSKTELIFQGIVETKVETINGGKPCIRKGPITFFAKGSRQYWRMQEMTNCEGGMLVDYVDVYFK